jgi:hypothetical protein
LVPDALARIPMSFHPIGARLLTGSPRVRRFNASTNFPLGTMGQASRRSLACRDDGPLSNEKDRG